MNQRDRRRFERLTRVLSFGHENRADFSASRNVVPLLASLESHRTAVEATVSNQQPERIDKSALSKSLTATCRQIATIARAIARRDKSFVGIYKLPVPITDVTLIAHADSLLAKFELNATDTDAAQQTKTQLHLRFAGYEIADDFVETLRNQRNAMRDAIQFNQVETQSGVEATSRIGSMLDAATLDIQDLDATMVAKYSRNPDKLKAWRSASHLEATTRKASVSAPTLTTPSVANK